MSVIGPKYGTSTVITITLASLADTAKRQALAVDNATDLFLDVLISGKIKTGASGTSATGNVGIFVYGSVDDGVTYSDFATGLDASFSGTPGLPLKLVAVAANSTSYSIPPFSVARAFDGVMPKKWGIIVQNSSGGALSATGSDHVLTYQGVKGETV